MPENALIASYDAIEIGVGGSYSLPTGYGSGDFGAELVPIYAPDSVNLTAPFQINVGATTDSGGSWYALYQGLNAPFGGVGLSGTGSLPSELSCYARFLDVKVYTRYSSADVHFVWSAIEIRINGSLASTLPGGSMNSAGMGPMYVAPLSGIVQISGGAGASYNEAAQRAAESAPDGSFDNSGSATAGGTITGGYRYLKDGAWFALPVHQPTAAVEPPTSGIGHNGPGGVGGTVTAPYGLSFPDAVAATSTWGSQLVCHYQVDYHGTGGPSGSSTYTRRLEEQGSGGSIVLIPAPPRALNRINPDFLASAWYWATPQVLGSSARSMSRLDTSPPDAANVGLTPVMYAHHAYGAEELGSSAGHVDALCAIDPYLAVTVTVLHNLFDRGFDESTGVGYTHDKSETATYSLPNLDADSSVEHGATPYLEHAVPLARYVNSAIVHPFWSIGYVPGDWNLGGSPQRWATDPADPTNAGYWGYVREQFLSGQGRRNHVVSCPLEVDGWQQFLDAFNTFGETSGKRWMGVSRWLTQEVDPPSSVTMDATGSDAWSAIDSTCTLAFGSGGVTVTGSAGAVCKVRIDVGRFDVHPYLYPLICDRLTLGWESSGVDSVKAFAATSYGDRAEFVGLTSGTAQRLPIGQDSKYAGSWGFDDGAGIADDGGTDAKPSGVSAGLCADPENSLMFRLLAARSPGRIEIEVTLDSDATEAVLHWPVWLRAEGERRIEAENGQVQSVVYADGPGIRFGNQVWYADGFFNPPLAVGLGYKWTLVDWLCFKRLVLLAQPFTGGTPDLTTELTQIFDPYEVQSVGAAAFGTLAFLLPSTGPEWRMACVHAVGEIPPLAALPRGGRGADWSESGSPNAGVWAWAQGPRRIVTAGTVAAHLHKPDGTQVTAEISAPSGWKVSEHSSVVDNTESPDWTIRRDGETWANVTPWHGWLWAGGYLVLSLDALCILHTPDGTYWKASNDSDDALRVRTALLGGPRLGWWTTAKVHDGPGNSNACLGWDGNNSRATLLWDRSDGIYESHSDDDGKTWSDPALSDVISGGKMPRQRFTYPDGDELYVALADDGGTGAGKLVGRFKGRGDPDYGTAFDLTIHPDSSIDPGDVLRLDGTFDSPMGYDVFPGHTHEGRWSLALRRPGDSASTDWFSVDDGKTYKPAT